MKIWTNAKLRWRLTFLPPPSNKHTKALRAALVKIGGVKKVNNCQVFIRTAMETIYGKKFDAEFDATARLTGLNFKGTKYDVTNKRPPRPGDIVYTLTGSNGFGHAQGLIERGMTAENMSLGYDGKDARNMREWPKIGPNHVVVDLSL